MIAGAEYGNNSATGEWQNSYFTTPFLESAQPARCLPRQADHARRRDRRLGAMNRTRARRRSGDAQSEPRSRFNGVSV